MDVDLGRGYVRDIGPNGQRSYICLYNEVSVIATDRMYNEVTVPKIYPELLMAPSVLLEDLDKQATSATAPL